MQPDPDLTKLSPAALDAWLGACEKELLAITHVGVPTKNSAVVPITLIPVEAYKFPALVRYVRTMNGAFERQLTEAGTLRKERAALAARVAELEGALLGMQQKCEGEYPKYHNDGAVPAWESMTMDIKHALDGGKETK